jgi:hypothetical protein
MMKINYEYVIKKMNDIGLCVSRDKILQEHTFRFVTEMTKILQKVKLVVNNDIYIYIYVREVI